MLDLENKSFGDLLCLFRERTVDRRIGKPLSQERLARKLTDQTGYIFNRNHIGSWEADKVIIPARERRTLIALIKILFEYGGITNMQEADQFLRAGHYQALTAEESMDIGLSANKTASPVQPAAGVRLHPAECGNSPINLAQQRLLVSATFGSYFAGLLERPNIHLDLEPQIECPVPRWQEALSPLQRLFWLLQYPKGPRTLLIAGEGGMGKSTLSARIIRCLYQEEAVDVILGDSAKSEHIDPASGRIMKLRPGYYDAETFHRQICNQLGLPMPGKKQAVRAIQDRLIGRKAIIVVDNLETVRKGDELLRSLTAMTSRDVRAIVTTRQVSGLSALDREMLVVHLQPLTNPQTAERFLLWHIQQHQAQQPRLAELQANLVPNLRWLITRTGGNPLLMQLVLNDVARYSWAYMETLPALFGKALLDFLYQARWDDLGKQGQEGAAARELLKWIAEVQNRGESISATEMARWASARHIEISLQSALSLLFERFMIINQDLLAGHFSIYPSLAQFVSNQSDGV